VRHRLQPDLVPVECSVEIEIELNGYGDGGRSGRRAGRSHFAPGPAYTPPCLLRVGGTVRHRSGRRCGL
jgi:hypothetical protein